MSEKRQKLQIRLTSEQPSDPVRTLAAVEEAAKCELSIVAKVEASPEEPGRVVANEGLEAAVIKSLEDARDAKREAEEKARKAEEKARTAQRRVREANKRAKAAEQNAAETADRLAHTERQLQALIAARRGLRETLKRAVAWGFRVGIRLVYEWAKKELAGL